jgi:hypothetical protein
MPALFSVNPMDLHLFKEVFMPTSPMIFRCSLTWAAALAGGASAHAQPLVKTARSRTQVLGLLLGRTVVVENRLEERARFVDHDMVGWRAVMQEAGVQPV